MDTRESVLLHGGRLLDPGRGVDTVADVGFRDGRVERIGQDLPRADYDRVVDVTGRLVVPGMIDVHAHFNAPGFPRGADPDEVCLPHGVTTAVDAGTVGWAGLPSLRRDAEGLHRTRVFVFLHVSTLGLLPLTAGIEELWDPRVIDADALVDAVRANRSLVLGVKLRMTVDALDPRHAESVLDQTMDVVERAQCRLMVHVSGTPIALGSLVDRMRPGDVVTHVYNGGPNGCLDDDGKVLPQLRAARERGVRFDVGFGGYSATQHASHFDLDVARRALAQGFPPDTISTDTHSPVPGRIAASLPDVMAVMGQAGMELPDLLACVTANAAELIGADGLGTLEVGAVADAAVLSVEPNERALGVSEVPATVPVCHLTLRDGVVVHGG